MTWSEPIWIGRASHNSRPDRDGRIIGSLVSTPGATFLQRRTTRRWQLRATTGVRDRLHRRHRGPVAGADSEPGSAPVFSPPPLITRAAWGADESLRFGKGGEERFLVEYQPVEHVIIHHADTATSMTRCWRCARSTTSTRSPAAGVTSPTTYLVDFMGNVCEGRVGGEGAVGCHAEGHNAGSCGICLMGRFFDDAATRRCTTLSSGSPPGRPAVWTQPAAHLHDIGNLPTICGHRDVNNTTCPGDEFYMQLDTVRTEARRVIRGRDDPSRRHRSGTLGCGCSRMPRERVSVPDPASISTSQPRSPWGTLAGSSGSDDQRFNHLVRGPGRLAYGLGCRQPAHAGPGSGAPRSAADGNAGHRGAPGHSYTGAQAKARRRLRSRSRRRSPWKPPSRMVRPGMCRMVAIPKTRNNFGRHGRSSPPHGVTIVASGPLNLHVEPALWAAVVVTALAAGYMATVIAGPVEGEGIAWYQVSTPEVSKAGVTGHIANTLTSLSVLPALFLGGARMPARFGHGDSDGVVERHFAVKGAAERVVEEGLHLRPG